MDKQGRDLTVQRLRDGVAQRTLRTPDPFVGRERFYRDEPRTEGWLRIVVEWSGRDGRVYNAMVDENPPQVG